MKQILVIVLLVTLHTFSAFEIAVPQNDHSLLTSAISQIVQNFFVSQSVEFDLFVFENGSESLSDTTNDVIKTSQMPSNVVRIKEQGNLSVKISNSAILLLETIESFRNFLNHSNFHTDYPKDLYFLVYIKEAFNFLDVLELKNPFVRRSSFIINVSTLNVKFFLTSVKTFQNPDCRKWKPQNLNIFLRTHSKYFPEIIEDFQGCELVVAFSYPASLLFERDSNSKLHGIGVTIVEVIAQAMNFSVDFNAIVNRGTTRQFPEGRPHDIFILAASLRQIVNIDDNRVFYDAIKFESDVHSTQVFTTRDTVVLTSQPHPYSQLEKIFLPFEEEVWFWLVVTLIGGFSIVLIINFAPAFVQKFTFGSNISTPVLNFV
jgi:hypothetical protein